MPVAVQWPGHLPAGKVYNQPVNSLDIFATIATLAHAPTNANRPLDGVDLMPYLTGKKSGPPHQTLYLRMYDRGAFAVRSGDDKLVIPNPLWANQTWEPLKSPGKTNKPDFADQIRPDEHHEPFIARLAKLLHGQPRCVLSSKYSSRFRKIHNAHLGTVSS